VNFTNIRFSLIFLFLKIGIGFAYTRPDTTRHWAAGNRKLKGEEKMKARSFTRESTWLGGIGGYGCGYVVIPAGHPYHGSGTDECEDLSVHGGVTFARSADALINNWKELTAQDKGCWVIGFDTAHYGDSLENWPQRAVVNETERLLAQLDWQSPVKEKAIKVTGSEYPCGPCELPLKCSECGTIITTQNVVHTDCDSECEICDYCGNGKCPNCLSHWHCGGCV
jgi:hypothetical protein